MHTGSWEAGAIIWQIGALQEVGHVKIQRKTRLFFAAAKLEVAKQIAEVLFCGCAEVLLE